MTRRVQQFGILLPVVLLGITAGGALALVLVTILFDIDARF